MKRFLVVGHRRYRRPEEVTSTRWDWHLMQKLPCVSADNTPQAFERLQKIGLFPELCFYVDLLPPGNNDTAEDRRRAAHYVRGLADAFGLIIVPLGRLVSEAFAMIDPRTQGRIGETCYGVLSIPNPHNKLTEWWNQGNIDMLRNEVERLIDSDDFVDGVEVDVVNDAIRAME